MALGAIIAELLIRTWTIALLQGSSGRSPLTFVLHDLIHMVAEPARLRELDLVVLNE